MRVLTKGVKVAKASSQVQARERAREARMRLDSQRDARDAAVESAATDFFIAQGEREAVQAQLAGYDEAMAEAVTRLGTLGESASRIATLLGVDAREVRRLKDLLSPVVGA